MNSKSDADAERSREALYLAVTQKLAEDRDLERRLELVENRLLHGVHSSVFDNNSIRSGTYSSDTLTVLPDSRFDAPLSLASTPHMSVAGREFEDLLKASWVYRRTQEREENMSFRSSVCRQSAWSVLSDLSLADLSVLSVIALPISAEELYNGKWYASDAVTSVPLDTYDDSLLARQNSASESAGSDITIEGDDVLNTNMALEHYSNSQPGLLNGPTQNEVIPDSPISSEPALPSTKDVEIAEEEGNTQVEDKDEDVIYICKGCGEVSSACS